MGDHGDVGICSLGLSSWRRRGGCGPSRRPWASKRWSILRTDLVSEETRNSALTPNTENRGFEEEEENNAATEILLYYHNSIPLDGALGMFMN